MKKKIIGKKGNHVGMMISFVIFVTFLFFLYFVVQPSLTPKDDREFLLDSLESKLIDMFYDDLTIITISNAADKLPTENCIRINQGGLIDLVDLDNVVVRDKNDLVKYHLVPEGVVSLTIGWDNENLFKIYASSSLNEVNTFILPGTCATGYNLNSFVESRAIFSEKILEVITDYKEDYDKLKNDMDVLVEDNFGFEFLNSDGSEIDEATRSSFAQSIYVRKVFITYYDEEANIKTGFINLKVW